ncbi:homoserine kinase [Vagococcus humatus]|uniref:Homoserine kinase n=1 Tax=Vagococcus humatus TaxID=1889241 RepID=A0A3R9YCP1_9ENTE|nr:homoserine kinase [Vagococcus humatus]RST89348.1 homoserine kinase [Vagococcus humatus]
MIEIRVPATSANLGLGFDCLGMALTMEASVQFSSSDQLIITGCDKKYQGADNLIYQAYCHGMSYLNQVALPVHIHINSPIPPARGLGSSATCVVAGILAAYGLTGTPVNREEVLKLATELEGHPDNVAPAILGGLTASYQGEKQIYTITYPVHSSYRFAVFIPDFPLETQKARAVLPQQIAFSEAVSNQSQLLCMLESLKQGEGTWLKEVLKDHLHEPYRKKLITEYEQVKKIAERTGAISLVISGSGPTLLAIYQEQVPLAELTAELKQLEHKWDCQELSIETKGAYIC